MLNVKNRDSFKEDCDMLMKKLGDLIIPGQYNISNGTAIPHITLGFSKNAEKLSENIVSMCKIENATIQNIDVSPAGKHGVVLLSDNNLEAFM